MRFPTWTAVAGVASRLLSCDSAASGESTTDAEMPTLLARQAVGTTPMGEKNGVACGIFSTASKNDVVQMLRLFDQGYAGEPNATCSAPPWTCRRQACRNTSGLYLCNDTGDLVAIDCGQMAAWLQDVSDQCCTSSTLTSKGLSGQQFSSLGWNVAVAYANCKHGVDADRPGDFNLWGPNGQCESVREEPAAKEAPEHREEGLAEMRQLANDQAHASPVEEDR